MASKLFPTRAVPQQDLIMLRKTEQEGKENSGSSGGEDIEERGMLTEPSSGVRIKCWQRIYIMPCFETFLCKLCLLGLPS